MKSAACTHMHETWFEYDGIAPCAVGGVRHSPSLGASMLVYPIIIHLRSRPYADDRTRIASVQFATYSAGMGCRQRNHRKRCSIQALVQQRPRNPSPFVLLVPARVSSHKGAIEEQLESPPSISVQLPLLSPTASADVSTFCAGNAFQNCIAFISTFVEAIRTKTCSL
jgi:hypothetical protein